MTLSGFFIGGTIPAVCLGLGTVFMRARLGAGVSIPHAADAAILDDWWQVSVSTNVAGAWRSAPGQPAWVNLNRQTKADLIANLTATRRLDAN